MLLEVTKGVQVLQETMLKKKILSHQEPCMKETTSAGHLLHGLGCVNLVTWLVNWAVSLSS